MLDPLHNIRLRHRFFDQVEAEDPYEQAKRVCSLLPVLMGGFGSSGSYQISRSMRLRDDGANVNLTRTIVPTVGTKWTFVARVKRGKLGAAQDLLSCGPNANNSMEFGFTSGDALSLYWGNGSAQNQIFATTAIYRDPAAWYDIQLAIDTTQVTATNRAVLYVNGVQVTSFAVSGFTSLGQNFTLSGANTAFAIGNAVFASAAYFGGLIADVHFVDGQTLSPSSFGRVDGTSGVWVPMAYTGTYGTSGFHLDFSDNSAATAAAIGKDSSGNGNNWTPNNASVAAGTANDSFVDTPTNYGTDTGAGGEVRGNYCTLNPLQAGGPLLAGNLSQSSPSAAWVNAFGTMALTTGKWYFEATIKNFGTGAPCGVGVAQINTAAIATSGNAVSELAGGCGLEHNGTSWGKNKSGAGLVAEAAPVNGDVVGVGFDVDSGTIWFSKNGTWYDSGAPATATNPSYTGLAGPLVPYVSDNNGAHWDLNFGQRPFANVAPSGFKAICAQNLADPTIKKPGQYFSPVIYTGTGATRSLTGFGFSPDLTWFKERGASQNNNVLDTSRGALNTLYTDLAAAAGNDPGSVSSFDADGVTMGSSGGVNTSGGAYVCWAWKKGVTPGFDIVLGTSGAAPNNHSLGVKPAMIITKSRDIAQGWPVAHKSVGPTMNDYYIVLSATGAASNSAGVWGGEPTATQFYVSNAIIGAGGADAVIAYLFAEIAGFSKFGSYNGNGSADGPFLWCGFRPRFVLVKATNAATNWVILDAARDAFNPLTSELYANLSAVEDAGGALSANFCASGIKISSTNVASNASGNSYIFAAFAETPFKYARAR